MTKQEFIENYTHDVSMVMKAMSMFGYSLPVDEVLGKLYEAQYKSSAEFTKDSLCYELQGRGYNTQTVSDFLDDSWPIIKINCTTIGDAIEFSIARLPVPALMAYSNFTEEEYSLTIANKLASYESNVLVITEDTGSGYKALSKYIPQSILHTAESVCGTGGLSGIKSITVSLAMSTVQKRVLFVIDALGITGSIASLNDYCVIKNLCSICTNLKYTANYMSFEYEVMQRITTRLQAVLHTEMEAVHELIWQSHGGELYDIPATFIERLESDKPIPTTEHYISGLLGRSLDNNYKIAKGDIDSLWFTDCPAEDHRCSHCKLKGHIPNTKADDVFGDIVKTFVKEALPDVKSIITSQ